jgi:hypothetical protein
MNYMLNMLPSFLGTALKAGITGAFGKAPN